MSEGKVATDGSRRLLCPEVLKDVAPLGGFLVAGALALLMATPYGIGISPDSITYLGGARNLALGKGFSMPPGEAPIVQMAPLYSVLLSVFGWAGLDPVAAARWVAAGLLGVSLGLFFRIGIALGRQRDRGIDLVVVGLPLFAMCSRPVWEVYLMAWSEPAFIVCCLLGFLLMGTYLERRAGSWMLAAAAVVAATVLTRYAGLALVAAGGLVLLVTGERPFFRKVRTIALFSVVSLGPFLLWSLRNFLAAGTATNRTFAFHPVDESQVHQVLTTAGSWLLVPDHASGFVKLGVLGSVAFGLVLGIFLEARRYRWTFFQWVDRVPGAIVVAFAFALIYPGFLFFSISFVDANTPLDQRLLAPWFVALLVLAAYAVVCWRKVLAGTRWQMPAAGVLGLLFAVQLAQSLPLARVSAREGLGFNNLKWRQSELVSWLREGDSKGSLYSNFPAVVYLFTGRDAKSMPVPILKMSQQSNPSYRAEVASMMQDLQNGGALVVFRLSAGPQAEAQNPVLEGSGLVKIAAFPEGAVYRR